MKDLNNDWKVEQTDYGKYITDVKTKRVIIDSVDEQVAEHIVYLHNSNTFIENDDK